MNSTKRKINLEISGMTCSGCANKVEDALTELDGVENATIDYENNAALVTYQPNKVTTAYFEKATESVGYTFSGIKNYK